MDGEPDKAWVYQNRPISVNNAFGITVTGDRGRFVVYEDARGERCIELIVTDPKAVPEPGDEAVEDTAVADIVFVLVSNIGEIIQEFMSTLPAEKQQEILSYVKANGKTDQNLKQTLDGIFRERFTL